MSALVVLQQHSALHFMVDGAQYDADGVLGRTVQKCRAYPLQQMAVAALGACATDIIFDKALADGFASFDELVDDIEAVAPSLVDGHDLEDAIERFGSQLFFAGWSRKRERLEAYTIGVSDNPRAIRDGGDVVMAPFKLRDVPRVVAYPTLDPAAAAEAGLSFAVGSEEELAEAMDPEVDLLCILEILRRQEFGGRYLVGGAALLTSVSARGIEQRVIHWWAEDEPGEFISPLPIDWRRWRSDRLAEAAGRRGAPVESRLQKEMRSRRERKLSRRV